MTGQPAGRVDVHTHPGDRLEALREDVVVGLSASPKELPPKWFYDDLGSVLFDAVTRLPDYYPTRAERALLDAHAPDVAAGSGAETLVEIGSGSSEKTRHLLDALRDTGRLRRFVAFDVSEPCLRSAISTVGREYPGVEMHGVVGDFERHLPLLPRDGRRLVAFLGSTIGNLAPKQRALFLAEVSDTLDEGDTFLLGVDLVKDTGRLLAAYDDPHGVTAAFNRNVLAVLNRELAADFALRRFAHVAAWDAANEWVEMRLRSRCDQEVTVGDLGLTVSFAAGEEIRTEISAKFRRDGIEAELAAAGLTPVAWCGDAAGDFALSVSRAV